METGGGDGGTVVVERFEGGIGEIFIFFSRLKNSVKEIVTIFFLKGFENLWRGTGISALIPK